jgi:hypothetical protein
VNGQILSDEDGGLDLVCDECGEIICGVEHGDTLDSIMRTENLHDREREHPEVLR